MTAAPPLAPLRLGVNIDHVATLRNARGAAYPDPVRAALVAQEAGADGITAHLREDRRHIIDSDIDRLMAAIAIPLNAEPTMAMRWFTCALPGHVLGRYSPLETLNSWRPWRETCNAYS